MNSNTCRRLTAAAIAIAICAPCATGAETLPVVDTTAGIKAAQWGKNVAITFGQESFTLTSDGIPSHPRPARYLFPNPGVLVPKSVADLYASDDSTQAQYYSFTLPLHPVKNAAVSPTGLGPIGILVSGAVLFSPYDADEHTIALQRNFTVDGVSFIDACNGHPTPEAFKPAGIYHYHGAPHCITHFIDKPHEHSGIIGVALDGFPIYGPLGKDGSKPAQLDECNGHTEQTGEFPQGIYHYHLTESSPYSMRCLAGEALPI
jgi:hypothetical protein